ncbi:hypothetical protein HYV49_02660 [Candidatus Pacearchaeota archaeon]|nr:hypothetical protein [Candidatus Pacearchaeota archaeon]
MNRKKVIYWLGTILLFAGLLLAFLPHATHEKIGLDKETGHSSHIISGITLIIISLIILIKNQGARISFGKTKR